MQIRSPGLLYGGLTIADIRRKILSERRNELMAELLHRVHFIEKWGRGIKMILEREPQTEFEELGTHFIATFKRNSYELTNPVGFDEHIGETTQKSSQKIFDLIAEYPNITIKELAEQLKITDRAVKKNIDGLKKAERLRRVGNWISCM